MSTLLALNQLANSTPADYKDCILFIQTSFDALRRINISDQSCRQWCSLVK
jgi:hypothetical protein